MEKYSHHFYSDFAAGKTPDFRIWLQQQFSERCRRNPRYSLRAFAKLLKMEASSISQIFAGKRKASTKVISRVCSILGAEPFQVEKFNQAAKAEAQIAIERLTRLGLWL